MLVLQGSRPNPDPGPFLGLQGLKHSLSGFFLPNHRFQHLQAGLFQDAPVSARFLGAKDAFKLFLSLYQPPGCMVSPKSCTFTAS